MVHHQRQAVRVSGKENVDGPAVRENEALGVCGHGFSLWRVGEMASMPAPGGRPSKPEYFGRRDGGQGACCGTRRRTLQVRG
jgi:hypothetical protein